jgi:hypothetical protein
VVEAGVTRVCGLQEIEVRVGVTVAAAKVRLAVFDVPLYDAVTVAL